MEIGWTDVGRGGYILVSCAHSNTSYLLFRLVTKSLTPSLLKINIERNGKLTMREMEN